MGPLNGFKVVEFAEGVAGPYCCMQLADAGADVIKVEPICGDVSRKWGMNSVNGETTAFLSLNRNKRGIAINEQKGSEIINKLVTLADVIVVDANKAFHPSYEEVVKLNPSVIYCSISGFGDRGPWADSKASELTVQLLAEATSSLGKIPESPVRLGTPIAQMYASIYSVQAICAALYAREESGMGQLVDVSLFGSVLAMRSTIWMALSNPDEWWGFHIDNYVKPPFSGYKCKDISVYFQLRDIKKIDIEALLEELQMTWVKVDPLYPLLKEDTAGGIGRYSHLVHHLWEQSFSNFTGEEVISIIERHGGTAFPINDYSDLIKDEQVKHLKIFNLEDWKNYGEIISISPPWTFSNSPLEANLPPPHLSEQFFEILSELNFTPDEIHSFIQAQVVIK
jgi:crotonobetainyl-CoA:carnitine CoA-transferase CaiB-like acyl-CoA transferase